ncbi:MAG: hypothetical protein IPQ08_11385 [Chitinophagaceae bacterium]|nr:hypothetical protein [Chitinophagaceae bacterium]
MHAHTHIALLCNPLAGTGRASLMASKLTDHLQQKQISFQLFIEEWPADLHSFSEAWIIGGDGTVNYFVNKYPNIPVPLVIFNGGTGNDVHWLLYGNVSLEQQLLLIENAVPRPVDLATCNDRYFLNGIGIGFEGAVAKDLAGKRKRPGKASFLIAILKRIFFYTSRQYHTVSEELTTDSTYMIIDVANGQRAGGGFHIAPLSAIDDGWLDVVLVNKLHPLLRLRYLPVIEKGKHLGFNFIKHYKTRSILITSEEVMLAHLDGEVYSGKRFEIGILPGQLLVKY